MTNDVEQPPQTPDDPLAEFRALVLAAFEQALKSGKSNWEEMTSAVLKNRLLDMTGRQFSQERYGSPSFIHLIRRIPDLVEVLDNVPPFRLKIKVPVAGQVGRQATTEELVTTTISTSRVVDDWRQIKVRDDLWRAVIDYSSGRKYVLDPKTGLARPQEPSDVDVLELPTTNARQYSEWRKEFAESVSNSVKPDFVSLLQDWAVRGGPQTDLPRQLRGRWAEFVKKKVSNRLEEWYIDHDLHPPDDMLLASESLVMPSSEEIVKVVQTRQLRDLIIRAVRVMTYEELASIPLPAEVVLRISGSKSDDDG